MHHNQWPQGIFARMARAVRGFPFTTNPGSESRFGRFVFGFFAGALIAFSIYAVIHTFVIVGMNIVQMLVK